MLLAAAGVPAGQCEPKGVAEIAAMCGRLPFALGIAGRLSASLGVSDTGDWSGMLGVLREELRESHAGGTTEEGMIRASLPQGLRAGAGQRQENAEALRAGAGRCAPGRSARGRGRTESP